VAGSSIPIVDLWRIDGGALRDLRRRCGRKGFALAKIASRSTSISAMHSSSLRIIALPAVLTLVCFSGAWFAPAAAQAQGPRERSEKNALRGMTGEFDGVGMVLWVSRDEAQQLLPPNPDLRLDYPGGGDRYPIVLLLGSQHDVGVQLRRAYIHPRFLKQYENAYVIVPYLRHPAASGHVYTFSKIFVSDERVTEQGAKLNHSPKVHAEIEDGRDRFVVTYEGQRRIDLTMQEGPSLSKLHEASAGTKSNSQATVEFLHAVFRQPKIEFSPNPHVFAFDFMAEASGLSPALVSGTIVVPAEGSAGKPNGVTVLSPDRPIEAVRFSSHWTKTLQH
jgi:hypothetical protein